MTFRSLIIESHPSRESAQAPYGLGERYEDRQSLDAHANIMGLERGKFL
jgi:hypothetical protein